MEGPFLVSKEPSDFVDDKSSSLNHWCFICALSFIICKNLFSVLHKKETQIPVHTHNHRFKKTCGRVNDVNIKTCVAHLHITQCFRLTSILNEIHYRCICSQHKSYKYISRKTKLTLILHCVNLYKLNHILHEALTTLYSYHIVLAALSYLEVKKKKENSWFYFHVLMKLKMLF